MTFQFTHPLGLLLLLAAAWSQGGCTRRYTEIDETFRCYRKGEYSVVIKKERVVMSEGLSHTANYLKESVAEWWLVTWNLRDLRDGERRLPTSLRRVGQRSTKGVRQGLNFQLVSNGIDWNSLRVIASDGTLILVEGDDRSGRSGGDLVSYSWVEGEPRTTGMKLTLAPNDDLLVSQNGALLLSLGSPPSIVELPSLKTHQLRTNFPVPQGDLGALTANLSADGGLIALWREGAAISAEVYEVSGGNEVGRVHDDSVSTLWTTHCAGTNASYVGEMVHGGKSASFRGRSVELPPEVTAAIGVSAEAHFDEDGTGLIAVDAFRNETLRSGVRCFRITEQQTNTIRATLELDAKALKALTP